MSRVIEMNYAEMLKTLYSVHPETKIKLGLERIEELLARLGNPQKTFKYVHVGGTNGKGTVVKTISAMLKAHGVKVGSYFSPHVETFRERIRFNDEYISKNECVEIFEKVMNEANKMSAPEMEPTFFEIVTAMAFLYFKEKGAKVVVSEVGLGGRFDATNVVNDPIVSVITTVDFDHMDILGNNLSKIAFEKAGIIKKGVPLVLGKMENDAFKVIASKAKEYESPIVNWEKDYAIANENFELGKNSFDFIWKDKSTHFETRMNGIQAVQNIAIALAALKIIEDKKVFHFDEKKAFDTVFTLNLEGRFEWIPSDITVILDAAHNKPAMKVLAQNLKIYFPSKNVNAVIGILNDKDYMGMIDTLAPVVKRLYITTPASPRATNSFEVYTLAAQKYDNVGFIKNIEDAVNTCHDMCKNEKAVMLISGSFYTIGKARTFLTGNLEADGE
ncbi:bifunctional folylpolyglutamate synthase/dihydrofolate synthase [Mesoaciditoga sp.]